MPRQLLLCFFLWLAFTIETIANVHTRYTFSSRDSIIRLFKNRLSFEIPLDGPFKDAQTHFEKSDRVRIRFASGSVLTYADLFQSKQFWAGFFSSESLGGYPYCIKDEVLCHAPITKLLRSLEDQVSKLNSKEKLHVKTKESCQGNRCTILFLLCKKRKYGLLKECQYTHWSSDDNHIVSLPIGLIEESIIAKVDWNSINKTNGILLCFGERGRIWRKKDRTLLIERMIVKEGSQPFVNVYSCQKPLQKLPRATTIRKDDAAWVGQNHLPLLLVMSRRVWFEKFQILTDPWQWAVPHKECRKENGR